VEHIARLGCPVLVVGGTLDQHTTVDDTQLLYASARQPKELWLIPNAAHVDYLEFAGAAYRGRILAFLAAALSQGAG
jgi:pimeloyl-ACP methyl ester carboxylesterase